MPSADRKTIREGSGVRVRAQGEARPKHELQRHARTMRPADMIDLSGRSVPIVSTVIKQGDESGNNDQTIQS